MLSSENGTNHWLTYNLTRAAWANGEFAKAFPNEKAYRHSLREEAAALRTLAELAARDFESGKVKTLDPALASLVKLNNDGLIEAYILFARVDEGIAHDYKAYRDKLRRYITEYVTAGQR
jgi:hypothetical protein